MLNGIDPIIIFHFYKYVDITTPGTDTTIPIVSRERTYATLPAIPIYLSETLTGLYIQSEDRDITIQTTAESPTDGTDNKVDQKASGSMINIDLIAKKDSIGLTLLSAMCDIILPKVTSKEYAVTYLHGATTVFLGLLEGLTVTQNKDNDLVDVKIKLSKANAKSKPASPVAQPTAVPEAATLDTGTGVVAPTKILSTPLKGPPPGSQPAISNTLG